MSERFTVVEREALESAATSEAELRRIAEGLGWLRDPVEREKSSRGESRFGVGEDT